MQLNLNEKKRSHKRLSVHEMFTKCSLIYHHYTISTNRVPSSTQSVHVKNDQSNYKLYAENVCDHNKPDNMRIVSDRQKRFTVRRRHCTTSRTRHRIDRGRILSPDLIQTLSARMRPILMHLKREHARICRLRAESAHARTHALNAHTHTQLRVRIKLPKKHAHCAESRRGRRPARG